MKEKIFILTMLLFVFCVGLGFSQETPTPVSYVNIAVGKPVEASNSYASQYGRWNAVDGNMDTIWGTLNPGGNEWIYIDLEEYRTIDGIGIHWYTSQYSQSCGLYVSADKVTWTYVQEIKDLNLDSIKIFGQLDCRYVGLLFWNQGHVPAIRELEVYVKDLIGTEVIFNDTNLEKCVRELIKKPLGPIYEDDMRGYTQIHFDDSEIIDLEGIQYFKDARELFLRGNYISDISQISGLIELERVKLDYNQITDVSPVNGLAKLHDLSFNHNLVEDLSVMTDLPALRNFLIMNNKLTDVSPINRFTTLNMLMLHNNPITDISSLTSLSELLELRMNDTQVSDISVMANWPKMERLTLINNKITDITVIGTLTNLIDLELGVNYFPSLEPLSTLVNLKWLETRFNNISDLTPVKDLLLTHLDIQDNDMLIYDDGAQGKVNLDIVNAFKATNCEVFYIQGNIVSAPTPTPTPTATPTPTPIGVVVTFPDPAFEAKIRLDLEEPTDDIYSSQLETLTHLSLYDLGVTDITGIEYCKNLIGLELTLNNISDISLLVGLDKLTSLALDDNNISDVSPLVGLTELRIVSLSNNPVANLEVLTTSNIIALGLLGINLTDISFFRSFQNIESLTISYNNIQDITPLLDMSLLRLVDLTNNNMNIYDDGGQGTANQNVVNALLGKGLRVKWEEGNITTPPVK